MFLDEFYERDGDAVRISRDQASRFAKDMAGDFNPIHDSDARRFCVPGDLLFALVLSHYGLAASMRFRFENMLGADTGLFLPPSDEPSLCLQDAAAASYLTVDRAGLTVDDPEVIERFIRQYIAFSGHNFPHYLKPLMESEGVMFNPQRPFVIYDRMAFELSDTTLTWPEVTFRDSSLSVSGRRGDARLDFTINDAGREVGSGSKNLVIGGLQAYDGERMEQIIQAFNERRAAHFADG